MKKATTSVPGPDSTVADPSKVPLIDIVRGLTTGQAWKLGGTFVAIMISAAVAGKWIEGWQREKAISAAVAPKDKEITELSSKVASLSGSIDELKASISESRNEIQELATRLVDAKRFIAFADKYLTYLSTNDDPARSILADHVCMLYRESQQAEIGVSTSTASVARILQDASGPSSRNVLVAAGYDTPFID